MRTEIISGLSLSQMAAGLLHLAVLFGIQRALDRLAKNLRVDRLSLVNDQSTKTAVVRALLTRFDLWIWGCGLYTLLAWHFNALVSSSAGPDWATPARQVAILQAITILALSSLGGRLIYVTNRRLRIKSLVISDAKETSIQLRALVSAADPDKLWTLRCDIREALISYVREKHPAHLVKTRVAVHAPSERVRLDAA